MLRPLKLHLLHSTFRSKHSKDYVLGVQMLPHNNLYALSERIHGLRSKLNIVVHRSIHAHFASKSICLFMPPSDCPS